jgi:putative ABC transport system substrate-binding protein
MPFDRLKRREFMLLGGAASAIALWTTARAQQLQGKLPKIGIILNFPNENFDALVEGLRELGYVHEQSALLEARFHRLIPNRTDELARELVGLNCSIIFAADPYAIRAAMRATSAIPIVGIDLEDDPVANGWAQSFPRPGGNFTGLFLDLPELGGKQIELLREVAPALADVGVVWDATIGAIQFREVEAAMHASGVTLQSLPIQDVEDIKNAIERAAHARAQALIVLTSPLIFNQRSQIADLALKGRLPMISIFTVFPRVGGLMAYGPNLASMFKRAASYIDRILRGAKPGELPIERPSKFELIINLKTAKALGLEIPWQLQQLADEVIE